MNHFRVIIDLVGDMGTIECSLDELLGNISFVDLDTVSVEVRNEGMTDDA